MKIKQLPAMPRAVRWRMDAFIKADFEPDVSKVLPYWKDMKDFCYGSFNWESKLRDDTRELEARNMRYAEAGERFLAEHYLAPCVATHTDQTRYFDEHQGNERWFGIEVGARKVEMMHAGAAVHGYTPYTAIGCDIPIPADSAVFYVGIKNAINNGWKPVLVSLPEWRGGKTRNQVFNTFLETYRNAGFDESDIAGFLSHPNELY